MQNHIHTGVISIGINAIGVIIMLHALRALAGMAVASDKPALQTVGKAVGGLVTLA